MSLRCQSNWLVRASLPDNSFPLGSGSSTVSGNGDLDFFAAFQIDTGSLAASFAIGLQVVAPTASVDRLGNQQWQLGVANVYFNATSPMFQYGYLLIYRAGGGDTNGRSRVNQGALQTFAYYQLGDGWYTGGAPIWCYNFNNDSYSIPL